MKTLRFLYATLIFTLLASLVVVAPVSAAGPSGSWVSGITCQNPDPVNPVSVQFAFYSEGSSVAALNYSDTIPAAGTLKYFTPSSPPGLPTSFLGSAVVSSGSPVNCSVNTQSTGTGTMASPYRVGTSGGFDTNHVGSTMYVPQVTKAGTWNTYMSVQNTASTDVTVDIHYYGRDTGAEVAGAKQTFTIKGNSNKMVYLADNANLAAPFYGSAKIVATNPVDTKLAVVVAFYNVGSDYTTAQFHTYNAFSAGASTLYAPRVVRKYYGYNSGISIQNIGTVDTTVRIDFLFRDGSTFVYNSPTVKQGASLILYTASMAELNGVDALGMSNRTGTAKITANAPGAMIAGNVNMDNRGQAGDNNGQPVPTENIGKGASFDMALDGTATKTVVFTQVPKKASGFTGGVIVSNAEATAGTCDISFAGVPGAKITGRALPGNGQISLYLGDVAALPNGFNASVSATCTKNVFGTYNFSIEPGAAKYGDSYIEDNAFNQ